MHKGHMTVCLAAIGVAVILLATTGGSAGWLGVSLAVLICPLTMGAAMWFLMGSQRQQASHNPHDATGDPQALDAPTAPHR